MQVQVFREHETLNEAWSRDASSPRTAAGVDPEALSKQNAERPQHEKGCKVEAVDLPADSSEGQEMTPVPRR